MKFSLLTFFMLVLLFQGFTNAYIFGQDYDYSQLKRYKSLKKIRKNPDSVLYVQLRHKHLRNIPPEIFACSNLVYLDLSFNKIKTIPPEIETLQKLRVLNLGNNKIQTIPPTIENCKELRTLILRFNELSQLPEEIGNLPMLTSLNLAGNYLNKLPPSMKNLQNHLQYLDMRVITLTKDEQVAIEKMLPNTTIFLAKVADA